MCGSRISPPRRRSPHSAMASGATLFSHSRAALTTHPFAAKQLGRDHTPGMVRPVWPQVTGNLPRRESHDATLCGIRIADERGSVGRGELYAFALEIPLGVAEVADLEGQRVQAVVKPHHVGLQRAL